MWYLYLNKEKDYSLNINGKSLEYKKLINSDLSQDYELEIEYFKFKVCFIKWIKDVKSKYYFHMLDENNTQKYKAFTRYNNNGSDFIHSVYVNSVYFNDFVPSKSGQISLIQGEENEKNEIEKELEDKDKLTREDINKLTDKILEKDVVNI